MVTRSLFTGVSGLQAHFDKMDTLSNNISNLNTPGFKKSNVVFKSFISQQTATATAPSQNRGGTNPQSVGLGVTTGSVNLDMSQGQLQRTGVNTDLALQGEGFFTVREAGSNRNIYTRAGSFQFDSNGNLVDPSTGNLVQGYNAETQNGQIQPLVSQGQPEDIQVTTAMESIPGQATTFQELSGNLDASAGVGIDPVTVGFENSQVRFEFERYHPEENMYKFNAVWTENPPSGKQIGDTVVDQVTDRELQGIMKLNEQGQVEGLFKNPDSANNFVNGIEQIEAAEGNAENYTINPNGIEVRDQASLFSDLQSQDWNGELRLRFTNNTGDYVVEWQDADENWNTFQTDAVGGTDFTANIGTAGDERLQRDVVDSPTGGIVRDGELEIRDSFVSGSTTATGDVINFTVKGAVSGDNGDGLLNRKGQEVVNPDGSLKQEFRWGGTGAERFRVSTPQTTSGTGSLQKVFNYDETSALTSLSNSNSINDIANKEFEITVNGAGTQFSVNALGSGDTVLNQDDSANMDINQDNRLFLDTNTNGTADPGEELGISIAAEDFSNIAGGETIQFTVTQARSAGSDDRGFGIVSDGDGNESALFMPQDNPDSNMNFAANVSDDTGIMDPGAPFTTLQVQSNGTSATASLKNESAVQTVASSDVFDSQGNQHTLNYTFEKQSTNTWIYHAMDPTPVNPDNPQMAGFGKIQFTENGQVDEVTQFNSQVPQQYPPLGPQQDIETGGVYFNPPQGVLQNGSNLDQGASPVQLDPDFTNISQFAGGSNLEIADQDGSSQGELTSLSFDQTGTLQGSYDNGERRDLAQLSIATFQNAEGLSKEGGTYFSESANSGIAQPGTAGSGGRGTITPGALERSNVELSSQFTRVISTQRGFQSNTRTITTTDQMVQSVLQLI